MDPFMAIVRWEYPTFNSCLCHCSVKGRRRRKARANESIYLGWRRKRQRKIPKL
jgi:hypothetical protein